MSEGASIQARRRTKREHEVMLPLACFGATVQRSNRLSYSHHRYRTTYYARPRGLTRGATSGVKPRSPQRLLAALPIYPRRLPTCPPGPVTAPHLCLAADVRAPGPIVRL